MSADTTLPVANLTTIDFARLVVREPSEIAKLFEACVTHGFFYLDLRDSDAGQQIIALEKTVLMFMEEYFAQPIDKKMLDTRDFVGRGYKPLGEFCGVTENSRDGFEALKVSRDEMVIRSPKLPEDIKKDSETFDTFIALSQLVGQTLLACLSDALNLIGSARFEASHREDQQANSTFDMLHYQKNTQETHIGHASHTDIGSLTLLFTKQWGLQVFSPDEKDWVFVEPKPHGHAIINIADSLRFLSGRKLYSCLHRVIPVKGQFQDKDRYSFAYFLRPESAAQYEDFQGRKVTAEQWLAEKHAMFERDHALQEQPEVLTGGMEKIIVN